MCMVRGRGWVLAAAQNHAGNHANPNPNPDPDSSPSPDPAGPWPAVRAGPLPLGARAGPGRSFGLELRAGPVRAVAPRNPGRSGPKPGHGPWINSTQRGAVVIVTREVT